MAEQIGTALATTAQQCSAPSTSEWRGNEYLPLTALQALPDRLDDLQLAEVQRIAALPAPPMPRVDEQHFLRCMRMLSVLPERKGDDLTAELRIALYKRHFGHFPAEAWSFLTEQATLKCKWFPSPQECDAILERWNRSDGPHRAHQLAQTRARQEIQLRFDELVARLKEGKVSQAEVDVLPERWKRILATQGFVMDVTYALRPSAVVHREQGEREEEGQSPAGVDPSKPQGAEKPGRQPEKSAG